MKHDQASIRDVVSDFVSDYIHALMSGRCRDDQWGLAFKLAKIGHTFVAVDPDPAVDVDPTSYSPRERFPVQAHAIFKPQLGCVRFSAPKPDDGSAPASYEMEDPVYIHYQGADTTQLWILSMNRLQEDGEPILVHRADPTTINVRSRHASAPVAGAAHSLH